MKVGYVYQNTSPQVVPLWLLNLERLIKRGLLAIVLVVVVILRGATRRRLTVRLLLILWLLLLLIVVVVGSLLAAIVVGALAARGIVRHFGVVDRSAAGKMPLSLMRPRELRDGTLVVVGINRCCCRCQRGARRDEGQEVEEEKMQRFSGMRDGTYCLSQKMGRGKTMPSTHFPKLLSSSKSSCISLSSGAGLLLPQIDFCANATLFSSSF